MNTQRALDKANDVIVSYLNGKATHDHNEAFIADSVGKIEEIAKVSSVMNENIIGDLPSSESYKNNILTVKKQANVLVADYKQKVVPLVAAAFSQFLAISEVVDTISSDAADTVTERLSASAIASATDEIFE